MNRYLYTLIFYIATPLILIRLVWRGIKEPSYLNQLWQRFGFIDPLESPVIWVHAVSAGESIAAVPLIDRLLNDYSEHQIVVTNMTPTGRERIRFLFAGNERVTQAYAPYDLPDALGRFLRRCSPQLLLIVDTELWPNMLNACRKRKIPAVLVNGRLSEKSARGYARVSALTREMLGNLSCACVQTKTQGERFQALGLDGNRLMVAGSIKFDLKLPDDLESKKLEYQKILGSNRFVFVAASTHHGEESELIESVLSVSGTQPDILLILAPRHPHRFGEVTELVKSYTNNYRTFSSGEYCEPDTSIYLLDTLGELLYFYALADLAFIGGSLVPVGGHNLMEAGEFGVPVLMGPYDQNVADIVAEFKQAGALLRVSKGSLTADILQLKTAADERLIMGEAALNVMQRNKGSLERTIKKIEPLIISASHQGS